jgi:hypothetical protein
MSELATGGATRAETPPPDPRSASTAELVGGLTEQITALVRDVQQAAPPLPTEMMASVQNDIATVKQGISR